MKGEIGTSGQRHDPRFDRAQKIRALVELKRMGRSAPIGREGDGFQMTRSQVYNTQRAIAGGSPEDARFVLIDYRNGNCVLASRVMNRADAKAMNVRLADTGFAWAIKGGY